MVKERLQKIITLWRRMDRIGENLQWMIKELTESNKHRDDVLRDTHTRIDGLREEISTTMQEILQLIKDGK